MLGAQCVELVGQFLAVGGGQLGQFEAGTGLGFVGAAAFDEQLGHLIGADLVELVDLTQHAFDICKAQTTVEAFGEFAVVRMHGAFGRPNSRRRSNTDTMTNGNSTS